MLAHNAWQVMFLVNTDDGNTLAAPYASRNFVVDFVVTPRKQRVCVMFVRYPNAANVILFSHGNATDLGCMRDHLIDMAMQVCAHTCVGNAGANTRRTSVPSRAHLPFARLRMRILLPCGAESIRRGAAQVQRGLLRLHGVRACAGVHRSASHACARAAATAATD